MLFLLLYTPALIFLPILLLAGIIFVVVPGGFIVVLAGAYYFASAGLVGLVGLATKRRRRDRADRASGFEPVTARSARPIGTTRLRPSADRSI